MTLSTQRNPEVVNWTVLPPSPNDPSKTRELLKSMTAPEHKIADTIVTFENDATVEKTDYHEVRDYFESVSVEAAKAGESYVLSFRPRASAAGSWKDAMLTLVRGLKSSGFELRLDPVSRPL